MGEYVDVKVSTSSFITLALNDHFESNKHLPIPLHEKAGQTIIFNGLLNRKYT